MFPSDKKEAKPFQASGSPGILSCPFKQAVLRPSHLCGGRITLGVLCSASGRSCRSPPCRWLICQSRSQSIARRSAAFLFALRWCIQGSHGAGISFTNLSSPIKGRWLPARLRPRVRHSKSAFLSHSRMASNERCFIYKQNNQTH